MKFRVIIDPQCEEETVIRARSRTPLVEALTDLLSGACGETVGFREGEWVRLNLSEVCCFTVEDGKVFALTGQGKWQVRQRLYQLEETLPSDFVKINQSTLANLRQIDRFDTSVAGTLKVRFRNGTVDYVSRRRLRAVKERLGL